jgi:hypothetical protein
VFPHLEAWDVKYRMLKITIVHHGIVIAQNKSVKKPRCHGSLVGGPDSAMQVKEPQLATLRRRKLTYTRML